MILILANKKEEDILLRKELEEMEPRVKVYFILEHPPEGGKGFSGYAVKEVL